MSEKISKLLQEPPIKTSIICIAAASLGYLTFKAAQNGRHDYHACPPGPPRHYLIGAMKSFPKDRFIDRFCEWAVTYGEIVYAPLPGMKMVILNSHEIAHELLSKRLSSTAGRRVSYLVSELIGWEWSTSIIQPGPHHSNQRKLLRRSIGPQTVKRHDIFIESEVVKLMTVLSTFQGNPSDTMQHCVGHLVSRATYGDKIWEEMGKDLSHWNKDAMNLIDEAFSSAWFVDVLHFVRFVPDWIPGLRFKFGLFLRSQINGLIGPSIGKLFEKEMNSSQKYDIRHINGVWSFIILNDLLEEFGESDDVRDATAVLYTAASDTTTGGIIQFLHVLFLFPTVSNRVFREIQSVTQGLRLPRISDRSQFPYTEAVWKESVRWRPFFPLGLPHVNTQDEIIRGYFIPKGTMILQNTRQGFHLFIIQTTNNSFRMMLNDPKVWGDPEVFRPERFLEPGASQKPNPLTTLFGWGMRICPGMYLADRVVLHLVATIISLYKVEPLEGSKRPDPDSIEYTPKAIQ
ncbi:cytochrome P450 [Serendipita vermifera]|nr:cytochrome P450 [Serendipita vermifera]